MILKWIKKNWTDPVWSKVFAAGIISVITAFLAFIYSLVKEIPFARFISETHLYLRNRYIEINLFTLTIILFILVTIATPMLLFRVRLKNMKLPKRFRTKEIDLALIINGEWLCEYVNSTTKDKGSEIAKIEHGNNYLLGGKLYFVLTDIEFDKKTKQLKWTKTTFPHNTKHARETLTFNGEEVLLGYDDTGYEIKYTKRH